MTSTRTSPHATDSPPEPFHRPPTIDDGPPAPTAPAETPEPEEPRPPNSPAWAPLLSGVAVGSIVATVTGQALIVLFGATALVAAVIAWGSMLLVHRRRSRLWRNEMRHRRHRQVGHRVETIEWSTTRERRRHPSLDALVRMVRVGDPYLWSRRPAPDGRSIWDVEVRRRSVDHEIDDHLYVSRDVPETVSLAPGAIVGVYGPRSSDVSKALVLRLASAVGPSDLDVVGSSNRIELRIPHWRGSVDRRSVDDSDLHMVIVCTDPNEVASRTSIARRSVAAGRAALVVAAARRDQLPHNCTAVIEAGDDSPAPEVLDDLADALSSWTDPDLVGSDVPAIVPWCELHADGEIASRWSSPAGCLVRLGSAADGRVDLDLVRDGPHMVVVGTTGSGKSEFLRTLVLGLAAESPPERVQFVLIDFKGGAAFDAVRDLPHVVDVITDLDRDVATDEEAGQRVVDGLRAELVRREHLLREQGVSSLVDLESDSPSGTIATPARLVIVIDELARLQADVPAFVAALVDLAQRGRSLGVHLVVGTQTPGRVVTSEVLANSDIRVALRLNSASDSTEIVGIPIAARLPRSTPGRAVLRLANDDPVVFQVASTDGVLASTIEAIADAARRREGGMARAIWCPPLPTRIDADSVEPDVIGLIDDRRRQAQTGYCWDGSSNVLVVGGRGSGTTSALVTLADRWSRRWRRADHDREPLVLWFSSREIDDHEMVDRILTTGETSDDRRVLVVVDGFDVWSDRQVQTRHHRRLWERFGVLIDRRSVTVVASSTRDPMGVSRLGERFDHVLVMRGDGPLVPGRGRIEKTVGAASVGTVMQWVLPPDVPTFVAYRPERLSTRITDEADGSFAVRARDHASVTLEGDVGPVFLVIGPRGSGRTTTLCRRAETWGASHPEADVCWVESEDEWRAAASVDDRLRLLVVDDSAAMWNRLTTHDVDEALRNGHHLAIAVTPSVLRARPEHVLHGVRRYRTGLVLGPSAHEDVELFGVFDLDLSFVESAPGRGWLVDRGEVVDLVQVVLPTMLAP